jgi:DnaJ-related protein SCJ1
MAEAVLRQRHPPAAPGGPSLENEAAPVERRDERVNPVYEEDGFTLMDMICFGAFVILLICGISYTFYTQVFHGNEESTMSRYSQQMEQIGFQISVPLKLAYLGGAHAVEFQRQIVCRACKGTGAHDNKVHTCEHCHGHGVVEQTVQVFPGMYSRMQSHCPVCGGSGKHIEEECPVCHGRGLFMERTKLDVQIPPGVLHGQKIVHKKKGHEGIGYETGDVIVVVYVESDSQFARSGDHLNLTIPITLKEALLGFKRTIEHFDGRHIVVERNEVTSPDKILQFSREGMPIQNGGKGDLFIRFVVQYPSGFSRENEEKIKAVFR